MISEGKMRKGNALITGSGGFIGHHSSSALVYPSFEDSMKNAVLKGESAYPV